MSRLWPDTLHGELFPGSCRLARANGAGELLARVDAEASEADLLVGLERCLMESETKRKSRSRLSIVVSDSIAAIVPLPWQGGLSSNAELTGYAQLCFEKEGREVGADWAMHVEYPRYGAAGMAYALPRRWMELLLENLKERQIRLDSILPVSARAFCAGLGSTKPGMTILLLIETTQHCALVFRNGALVARDVEPCAQNIEATCRRLLARIHASLERDGNEKPNLLWWSSKEIEFPKEMLEAYAADAKPIPIAGRMWL